MSAHFSVTEGISSSIATDPLANPSEWNANPSKVIHRYFVRLP